jgi:hypothetical protein
MYDYLEDQQHTNVVGSFITDRNVDFKDNVKSMLESFRGSYSMDAIDDLVKVLKVDTLKEDYKERLMGDVLSESFDDPYLAMHPAKLEQLFENTALEIVQESGIGQLAPIVGLSLPILKKNYLENHAKDIVMTEVPSKPIVKVAFERKFLKDKDGAKHYIPDIFYNDSYKEVLDKTKGKAIVSTFFPEAGVLPVQDLAIMALSGGTMQTRDSLAYDFHVQAVTIEVKDAAGTGTQVITVSGLNIAPDMAANGSFTYRVKAQGLDTAKTVVEDILTGQVNFYDGTVSVASTGGKIKQVQFGGHLSNENNLETVELDRERETREWKIPDGQRINTGLTIEKLKDYKALFNIDVTTEVISDISTVLTQFEDSGILDYLDTSLAKWKGKKDLPFGYSDGFVESYNFSATPPSNVFVTTSAWIDTELKFNLNREIDALKEKLKTTDIMFVLYGNPANITLIQDGVKWVIDEDTKIGGIQLDYRFGVMTQNKNRVHVVSSMKVPRNKGIRIVAFPLSKEVITFKHYKYSLNIENIYRNPLTPLTPNVMGTSRHLTTEVLPVQGEFNITNNDFGRQSL